MNTNTAFDALASNVIRRSRVVIAFAVLFISVLSAKADVCYEWVEECYTVYHEAEGHWECYEVISCYCAWVEDEGSQGGYYDCWQEVTVECEWVEDSPAYEEVICEWIGREVEC